MAPHREHNKNCFHDYPITKHAYLYTVDQRINNKLVEQRDTNRRLGVTFSSTLRWPEHINSIIYNASRKLGILRRLRRTLTPAVPLDFSTTQPAFDRLSNTPTSSGVAFRDRNLIVLVWSAANAVRLVSLLASGLLQTLRVISCLHVQVCAHWKHDEMPVLRFS